VRGPDSWDLLKRAECDAPAPGNGTVNGVQVSVCSSDRRVHSRARHLKSCLTSRGQPQTPSPSHELPTPPNVNCPLAVHKLDLQSFVTRRSLPSRFCFEYCLRTSLQFFLSAPLLTCERIDVAQRQPPTLHLGADALERSRNHLIHDEHNPFQVDAKQLDIELALIVNPTYKINLHSCRDAAQPSPSIISLAGRAPTC
jgi:hypothetical protein